MHVEDTSSSLYEERTFRRLIILAQMVKGSQTCFLK